MVYLKRAILSTQQNPQSLELTRTERDPLWWLLFRKRLCTPMRLLARDLNKTDTMFAAIGDMLSFQPFASIGNKMMSVKSWWLNSSLESYGNYLVFLLNFRTNANGTECCVWFLPLWIGSWGCLRKTLDYKQQENHLCSSLELYGNCLISCFCCRQNVTGVSAYCRDIRWLSFVIVRHRVSHCYNSRTVWPVWPWIAKFYTRYGITSCFWSDANWMRILSICMGAKKLQQACARSS